MRETDHIVVEGFKAKKDPWFLYILSRQGGSALKEEAKIKHPCTHGLNTDLLSLQILWREYLAISCVKCEDIKLVDLKSKNVTAAFSGEAVYTMCSGWHKLFVNIQDTDKILELDCSSTKFTQLRTFKAGLENIYGMCYAPKPLSLLIVSDTTCNTIRAVDCNTGEVAWTIDGDVDGRTIVPYEVILLPRQQVILVSDSGYDRMLVLNGQTGAHAQTARAVGRRMVLKRGQIIARHGDGLTFVSIS